MKSYESFSPYESYTLVDEKAMLEGKEARRGSQSSQRVGYFPNTVQMLQIQVFAQPAG